MAQCISPFTIRDANKQQIPVPCGKCCNCLKRRANGWAFRLRIENRQHVLAAFVTLTYQTEFVPISKNGWMTLNKKDVQLFIKRLRQVNQRKFKNYEKIKYYVAGEYGSQGDRPHYHLIIFGCHPDSFVHAWRNDDEPLGNVNVDIVNDATIDYSLKYIHKLAITRFRDFDDRLPEFQLQSKGLGIAYLTNAMATWHKQLLEERYYVAKDGNVKIPMPRYYKLKIYDVYEKNAIKSAMEILNKERPVLTDSQRNNLIAAHHAKRKFYHDKV